MIIIVAKRVKEQNAFQRAEVLFSYEGTIIPRVGDLLDFKDKIPYEVKQVVHTYMDSVIIEVIEYDDHKNPPISSLDCNYFEIGSGL